MPNAHGLHQWLHEVLVSYEAADMPENAPIRFANGVMETLDVKALKFGETTRYGGGNQDLVRLHCAYVHIGPAQRRAAEPAQFDLDPEHEFEAEPMSGPAP